MSVEQRYTARQERSKPLLDEFYSWLDTFYPAGGTNLAKAVQYAKNEKRYLYRFIEDGDIPISNNRAENAIRPFVVGRKKLAVLGFRKGRRGKRHNILRCRYGTNKRA